MHSDAGLRPPWTHSNMSRPLCSLGRCAWAVDSPPLRAPPFFARPTSLVLDTSWSPRGGIVHVGKGERGGVERWTGQARGEGRGDAAVAVLEGRLDDDDGKDERCGIDADLVDFADAPVCGEDVSYAKQNGPEALRTSVR